MYDFQLDNYWQTMKKGKNTNETDIDKQWKCGKNTNDLTPQQTQGHGCKQLNTSGYYHVNVREKYIHETIKNIFIIPSYTPMNLVFVVYYKCPLIILLIDLINIRLGFPSHGFPQM